MTPEQLQERIVKQLGQSWDPDFREAMADFWELHQSKAVPGGLERVALYVRLEAIETLQGKQWLKFDYQEGIVRENKGDLFDHLATMWKQTWDRIQLVNQQVARGIAPALGQLETLSVFSFDVLGQPDPNDRVYRGDPVRRRFPLSLT